MSCDVERLVCLHGFTRAVLTMSSMKTPIKLTVNEPTPGSFAWMLTETDSEGANPLVLRRAEDVTDSYELALASGQRALDAAIRRLT